MIGIDTSFMICMEVREHPLHSAAWAKFNAVVLQEQEKVALAPQVLLEFIHVITDDRRFERPLSMPDALERAVYWWRSEEVAHIYATSESTLKTMEWLAQFRLGRKRLLDTQLAAALWTIGVRRILTTNARDFSVLPDMIAVVP